MQVATQVLNDYLADWLHDGGEERRIYALLLTCAEVVTVCVRDARVTERRRAGKGNAAELIRCVF